MTSWLVGTAIAAGIGVLLILLRWRLDLRAVRDVSRKLALAGARVEGARAFPGPTLWGEWRGRAFQATAAQVLYAYRTSRTVSLRIDRDPHFHLLLVPRESERASVRLSRVQTGDRVFDRQWDAWSNDPGRAERALGADAVRGALDTLAGRLEIRNGWARVSEPTGRLSAQAIDSRLDTLSRLADALA